VTTVTINMPSRRLSTRIVTLFLGLLLLVQLAGFAAIRASIESNARATLAQELAVGDRVWRRLLEQKSQALVQGASLLAADFGFREAVASADVDTIASALDNHGARIGAHVSAWVDTSLEVVTTDNDGERHASDAALRRIAKDLVRQQRASEVVLMGDRALQFVAIPIKAPVTIGWMVLGFSLDQALVDDMRELSGLHVALTAPAKGGAMQVLVSTIPRLDATELDAMRGADVTLAGESMVVRRVALASGSMGANVLLMRSVDEALQPYRQLQLTLMLITAVGVLVFAAGSVFTARHVTTPISALARAAEQLARGDYSQPLAPSRAHDEIGDLGRAFDHMRVSIAAHQAEIHDLAYRDRLTGLPNRAAFRDAVQRCIGEQSGVPPVPVVAAAEGRTGARAGQLAVLMFDLDRFKHVNDVLGYAFGDKLLQAVAERLLREGVRGGDTVARLSGDEFAVLLPGADATRADAIALRIAAALEQPLMLEDHTVDVRAGFGIACWPQHAADADALLSRAEVAMYAAKRQTVPTLVYSPAIDSGSAETLSLLSELRHALEHDELRVFLQPKICLADGALVGAEALVRWQHPVRGMLLPLHFVPFAEQTGFIRQLTLWVFDQVARQWPALAAAGLQRVSVNLSTRDLLDQDLPRRLDSILVAHGAPAHAFCLELTESAIMDEPQRALATLDALAMAGFKLSIDDFGTGYSSLAYLKRLPVHELKIDKSFVMAMEHDADDAKIVRSTIDLAHNLGLSVVAEGIENAGVWQLLSDLRCDEGQGFHMSRPLPASELAAFAERWRASRAVHESEFATVCA
jgi:diguanylate cyclase (GGDEF)-like protein